MVRKIKSWAGALLLVLIMPLMCYSCGWVEDKADRPYNLRVNNSVPCQITITWEGKGYGWWEIWRRTGSGEPLRIEVVEPNPPLWTNSAVEDPTLLDGLTYCYKVRAGDVFIENSDFSNEACAEKR